MAAKKITKLPETIYVKLNIEDGDEPFLEAYFDRADCLDAVEPATVGEYKLVDISNWKLVPHECD